ncbi:DUF2127 domain-containing protein [Sulfitobacter sp.]|uniref:DUF2127 domain-containing protein n=1 Tax=Sulfitobacter sp. TaxID=1903071 RepID=UPI0030036037
MRDTDDVSVLFDCPMSSHISPKAANHLLFLVTLIGKGVLGLIQLASAIAIYLGAMDHLPRIIRWLFSTELAERPPSLIAAQLVKLTAQVPASEASFYTIYFAAHGALHVGVVVALLWGARWAYDAAVVVLAVFVVYQLIEWQLTGGTLLLVLSAIDVAVIYLTVREKRERSRHWG